MRTSEVLKQMPHGQNSSLGKLDGPLIEAELGWIAKLVCCGRSQKRCDHQLTGELDLGAQRLFPVLGMCVLLAFLAPRVCSKDIVLR